MTMEVQNIVTGHDYRVVSEAGEAYLGHLVSGKGYGLFRLPKATHRVVWRRGG